jgi:hypothetical protein
MPCEHGHTWTSLDPRYQPGPGHLCDCRATRYVVPPRPPDLALWDIARVRRKCFRRGEAIGLGEPYRLVSVGGELKPYCATCATLVTGEPVPAEMPVRPVTADMKTPTTPPLPLAPLAQRLADDIGRAFDVRQRQTGDRD